MSKTLTFCFLVFCCRAYLNPQPTAELVAAGRDMLHTAILENLKSKSILPTLVNFRHDVFRYLFKNKGVKSEDGRHLLLEKDDFDRCHLPQQWDQILDRLGNGTRVEFLVKAKLFLSRSPKTHQVIGEKIVLMQRYEIEKLSIRSKKQLFFVSV